MADRNPTNMLALVGPRPTYISSDPRAQITHGAETANTQDDAVEEHQGVPLGALQSSEYVVLHVGRGPARRRFVYLQLKSGVREVVVARHREEVVAAFEVITKQLEKSETRHHSNHRRQMQEVVGRNRQPDGQNEQPHHHPGAVLQLGFFRDSFGFVAADRETHDHRRHQPVDHRGDEQDKKFLKLDNPFLPHHQGRDVTEGTECATGIGRHHDVDTTDGDELCMTGSHRHDYCGHEQGGGEIVGNR